MTDIVERLRGYAGDKFSRYHPIMGEAADEIERLHTILIDIDEMVQDYADADDGQPNLAMRIMTLVRTALEKKPARGHPTGS